MSANAVHARVTSTSTSAGVGELARRPEQHGRARLVPAVEPPAPTVTEVAEIGVRLQDAVRTAMSISSDALDVVLATLLSGGHLLVEDHPGVGKTLLARSLARSLDGSFSRVQATVDLLPSDIVGANIWRSSTEDFDFLPGPVFANVVLVDELNRATPKTQSGLLEAMQERQVTVDGRSHPLPSPFVVIATQNPATAYEGTYELPAAQLDRFQARISLGYPSVDDEIGLLRGRSAPATAAVSSPETLLSAQHVVARVDVSEALLRYVVDVLAATRAHPLAAVGASPRAGVLLLAAARARAALDARTFVVPDDVQALAQAVLAHRLQVAPDAAAGSAAEIVADVVAQTNAR